MNALLSIRLLNELLELNVEARIVRVLEGGCMVCGPWTGNYEG